jgi:Response regulator containing CheY-like receiver and SARP domains
VSSPEKSRNILVVEDEWLIALDLRMLVEEEGHVVIGPASTVTGALEMIEAHAIDAAFLDISLGAEKSFPVAEKLKSFNVPLTFVSAYARSDIPEKFHEYNLLPKPLSSALFRQQLLKMLR